MDLRHFRWPFLNDAHAMLAARAQTWIAGRMAALRGSRAVDDACREWVAELGTSGLLRYCVPASDGGALPDIDSRSVCVLREVLAYHDALADFSFAMQGLGGAPMALSDPTPLSALWLSRIASGAAIAAFALSEPDAGSDVGAIATVARREGGEWVINGCKTWISNGGIADFYCVFARTRAETGARGLSALLVPAGAHGLTIAERIHVLAPHPLARIELRNCRVPLDHLIGVEGEGFKLAMRVLDVFRTSVGAAAVGLARRALDEAIARARERRMFGATLADHDLARAKLGEMATALDATTLLVYRAAWTRDVQAARSTVESAMAKWGATEAAQRIIDNAVQMHGALGVTVGQVVERLYREIRALRIYEGASEVQKLVIGKALLGGTGGRVA